MFNVCLDKNECTEGTSGCNHHCTDFPGSFRCSCTAGYRLRSDGKTCQGRVTKQLYIPVIISLVPGLLLLSKSLCLRGRNLFFDTLKSFWANRVFQIRLSGVFHAIY